MNNHIGDTNKMVSDTPRLVDQILLSEKNDWTADLYRVGCDKQRELHVAQERIKQLEEELMDTKNKYAVLVADVVLNEDRAERIKQLEKENDALRADLLLWNEKEANP